MKSQDFQVFLSNSGKDRKFPPWTKKRKHPVDWVGFFVPPGYAIEECQTWVPEHYWPIERLVVWALSNDVARSDRFVLEAADAIAGWVPDSGHLQDALDASGSGITTPTEVVSLMRNTVNTSFPQAGFDSAKTARAVYKPPRSSQSIEVEMPLRAVAALVMASLVCEEANRGDMWYRMHENKGIRPKLGGCRMVEGIYLYRRFTKSTYNQISTILRAHVGP